MIQISKGGHTVFGLVFQFFGFSVLLKNPHVICFGYGLIFFSVLLFLIL